MRITQLLLKLLHLKTANTTGQGWKTSPDRSGYTICRVAMQQSKMVFERMAGPKFLRGTTVSLQKSICYLL